MSWLMEICHAGCMEPLYPYQSSMYFQDYNSSLVEGGCSPMPAALHMIPTSNSRHDSLHSPVRSPLHEVIDLEPNCSKMCISADEHLSCFTLLYVKGKCNCSNAILPTCFKSDSSFSREMEPASSPEMQQLLRGHSGQQTQSIA